MAIVTDDEILKQLNGGVLPPKPAPLGGIPDDVLDQLNGKAAAPAAPKVGKTYPVKAPSETILPGRVLSEYDTNIGGLGDVRGSLQGAQNLTQAPRKPKPLVTHQQPGALEAFMSYQLDDVAAAKSRPLAEARNILATSAPLPRDKTPLERFRSGVEQQRDPLNRRRQVQGIDPRPMPAKRQTGETVYNTIIPAPAMALQSMGESAGGIMQQVGDYTGIDPLAKAGSDMANLFEQRRQATAQEYPLDDNTAAAIRSGLSSFVQMLGPGALGALKGAKALKAGVDATKAAKIATRTTLLPMAGMTEGAAYSKYRDQGHDILPSTVGAGTEAVVEYWTEKLGTGPLMGYLTKTGKQGIRAFLTMGAKAGVGDQFGEQLASHLQELTGKVMNVPGASEEVRARAVEDYFTHEGADGLTEFQRNARDTAVSTLTMNVLGPLAAAGGRHLTQPKTDPITGNMEILPPTVPPGTDPARVAKLAAIMEADTPEAAAQRLAARQNPEAVQDVNAAPEMPGQVTDPDILAQLNGETATPIETPIAGNETPKAPMIDQLDFTSNEQPFNPNQLNFEIGLMKNPNTSKTAVLIPKSAAMTGAEVGQLAKQNGFGAIRVNDDFYIYDPKQIKEGALRRQVKEGKNGQALGYGTDAPPVDGIPYAIDIDGHGTLNPAEILDLRDQGRLGFAGIAPDMDAAVAKIREMGRDDADVRGGEELVEQLAQRETAKEEVAAAAESKPTKQQWEMTSQEYAEQGKPEPLPYDVFYVNGVEVVQNPTPSDYRQFQKEARERFPNNRDANIRFTEDAKGNRFIWKSYDAIHSQIEPSIAARIGREVSQNPPSFDKSEHRREIYRALQDNRDIPENVLDEYREDDVLGPLIKAKTPVEQLAQREEAKQAAQLPTTQGATNEREDAQGNEAADAETDAQSNAQGYAETGVQAEKEVAPPAAIPSISREDAIAAKQQVVTELATVDPDSDRSAQLQVMLDQYNQIIGGEAEYRDFQPAPVPVPDSEPVKRTFDITTEQADFATVKKMMQESGAAGDITFNVDNGAKIIANQKAKYLHATIVYPSGKTATYKENAKGNFDQVSASDYTLNGVSTADAKAPPSPKDNVAVATEQGKVDPQVEADPTATRRAILTRLSSPKRLKDRLVQSLAADYGKEAVNALVKEGMVRFPGQGRAEITKVGAAWLEKNPPEPKVKAKKPKKPKADTEVGAPAFALAPQTETPAFKKWFGNSKVVDAEGKPLVVYHGTDVDFTAFDKDKVKSRFPYSFGFHFTDRPSEASIYATGVGVKPENSPEGAKVIPTFIKAENPLVIKTDQLTASMEADLNRAEIIAQLVEAKREAKPYDSVIIRRERGDEWDGINVIVFEPSQIKSTFNQGTFDPNNPDIRFSTDTDSGGTLSPSAITRIESLIAKALPDGKVTVKVVDSITPPEGSEEAFAAHGVKFGKVAGMTQAEKNLSTGEVRSIITLAMDGATEGTGAHEALHVAEALGIITEKDGAILARTFPDKDGVASSERRADAFADYVAGKRTPLSAQIIFNKIRKFLNRLAAVLKGEGWRTADDVFSDLMGGKLKRNAQGKVDPPAGVQFMTAWHGSPHDHNKFDSSKIGTGEGAQAYGFGLYFAESRDVAEYYKKALSSTERVLTLGKQKLSVDEHYTANTPTGRVVKAIFDTIDSGYTAEFAVDAAKRRFADDTEALAVIGDATTAKIKTEKKGKLYQVELAPSEDEYLLWDKPLSEQSEKVKEALEKAGYKDYPWVEDRPDGMKSNRAADSKFTGRELYDLVANKMGRDKEMTGGWSTRIKDDKAASEYLHSLGIRGIKYLDGTSRGKGEGNYNFVIFSDQDVEITAKFSLTPAQQEAVDAAFGKQPTMAERWAELRKDLAKNLTQGIFDQFAPIKELDMGAYIKARMTKGADSTLEAVMLYGKPYIDGTGSIKVGFDSNNGGMNGFASILAQLDGEHDRFLKWVAGHRAARLKDIGLENLMDMKTILALKSLDTDGTPDNKLPNGKDRRATYRKVLKEMNDYNDAILKVAVERGLVNDATRQMYKDLPYIPFYRLQEEGVVNGFTAPKGLVNQTAWKKLKGGTNKLNDDMLANMLKNWSHLITASAKNEASKAILTKAVEIGAAQEVPAGYPGKGVVTFRENTTTVLRKQPDGSYKRVEGDTLKAGQVYLEDGVEKVSDGTLIPEYNVERHFIVSDPHLLDAITSIGATVNVPKVMRAFKNVLTTAVTINPTFKVRNLIRDSIASIALADLSYNPLANIKKGAALTAKSSETRAQMLAAGGLMRFGSMLDGASADNARKLVDSGVPAEHILDSPNKVAAFWKKYLVGAFDAYQEFGDRSEQVNRAALYKSLLEKGYTSEEAAFWARDLMDFSMSGKWAAVRFLSQTVPFFNARLQGMYKLGRSAKADKKRFGIVIGGVTLASLALLAAYGDDDDWKKREDWDRDNYWWFKVGDTAFRIPKPFEIGAIGTIAERSAELMFSQEMTGKRFAQRMRDIVSQQLSMNPTPQLVKPLIDLWANKDAFTQRPIETMGMDRLKSEDRYTERTSGAAKMLGQLGLPNPAQLMMGRYEGLSPVQVDSLVRGYFSWLGVMATTALDYGIFRPLSGVQQPSMKLKDVFLVGNFVESLPSNSSRYVTEMYESAKEIEQSYNSYRNAVKSGDNDRAEKLMEREGDKIRKHKQVARLKEASAKINQRIRKVMASKQYGPEEKRIMIDELKQRQDSIAQRMSE